MDPLKPAVLWRDQCRTYAELRRRALALAASFRRLGLVPGECVAAHLFNRGETFEIYFACAYAGLVFVPVNFRLAEEELAIVLADSGARLVFTERGISDVARAAIAASEGEVVLVELSTDVSGDAFDELATGPAFDGPYEWADPHMILFSSGTTGTPKGIALSHGNIMTYACQQAAVYSRYSSAMTTLVVPTMFNAGGINDFTIPTFLVGGTVAILPSGNWLPESMAALIEKWQVTHTVIFPMMFEPMLEADARERLPLDSLQVVTTGGEHCPNATLARFAERWPDIDLVLTYGLTEGGLVTLISGQELFEHPESVGRAAPGQTLKIVGADGEVAASDGVGEIWTASPWVVPGYWNAPALTAELITEDGWLRTGDLGRVDEAGYLYIEGRARDLIISKGQNIYPAEVEAVLAKHDAVWRCSVVGVPDREYGEAVCAVVVLRRDQAVTEDELIEFVRARIASYKKPRFVLFRDALPTSVNNYVLKRELAIEAAEAVEALRRSVS
jgi:fatty-acyl-CoA synthase